MSGFSPALVLCKISCFVGKQTASDRLSAVARLLCVPTRLYVYLLFPFRYPHSIAVNCVNFWSERVGLCVK